MKEIILSIIKKIHDQKTELKKSPVLILDSELSEAVTEEVLSAIKKLFKEEKIELGRTINNNYIRLRNSNSPPINKKPVLHSMNFKKETKEEIEQAYKCIYCEYIGDKDSFQIDLADEVGFDAEDMTCDKCHLNFKND